MNSLSIIHKASETSVITWFFNQICKINTIGNSNKCISLKAKSKQKLKNQSELQDNKLLNQSGMPLQRRLGNNLIMVLKMHTLFVKNLNHLLMRTAYSVSMIRMKLMSIRYKVKLIMSI